MRTGDTLTKEAHTISLLGGAKLVLNDQAIKAAKSGEILWDQTLKGFGCRIGSQSKTFIVLIASGRRKRLGRYPLLSLADARAAARKILAEKTLGKIVPKHTAYEDARDSYLKDCETRKLSSNTIYLYKRNLTKFFNYGRQSIAGISGKAITSSLTGLPPSEKEHAYRIGNTFFNWCFRQHLIDQSPFARLEPPPIGQSRERTLEDDELKLVYKHACKLDTQIKRLVWSILRMGQRPGETRHLKWTYIKPDRVKLPGFLMKNRKDHTFPISPDTYETLMTFPRIDDNEYVFPSMRTHVRGKPVYVMTATSTACKEFREESNTSGIKGVTLHKATGRWCIRINSSPYKRTLIGYAFTLAVAAKMRKDAEAKYGYL